MHTRTQLSRSSMVIAALVTAALACTLQIGGNNQRPAVSAIPTVDRPTVEIVQPADGARGRVGIIIRIGAERTEIAMSDEMFCFSQ